MEVLTNCKKVPVLAHIVPDEEVLLI